jgi:hypothetical protein
MGYGGTGYATVDVDIVQTDVDAIVQGLTGYAGMTFSDVNDRLSFMSDLLSGYYSGPLTSIDNNIWNVQDGIWQVRDYLSGYNYGPLTDIRDCLWADGYNAAWWMKEAAYRGSDILMYLSGGWNGPLTDIAWSNYEARDLLSGYWGGPLTDIRDYLSGSYGGPVTEMRDHLYYIEQYLWNGYAGQSAADLLGEIRDHVSAMRWQIDQMTFDGGGRLRVETQ